MACDKTFKSVEDLLRHGIKFHGSIDFTKLSEDVQDIATNTFQLYMRGDEGRTFEKNIIEGIKLKCKKTCILPQSMNRDPDEVFTREFVGSEEELHLFRVTLNNSRCLLHDNF